MEGWVLKAWLLRIQDRILLLLEFSTLNKMWKQEVMNKKVKEELEDDGHSPFSFVLSMGIQS